MNSRSPLGSSHLWLCLATAVTSSSWWVATPASGVQLIDFPTGLAHAGEFGAKDTFVDSGRLRRTQQFGGPQGPRYGPYYRPLVPFNQTQFWSDPIKSSVTAQGGWNQFQSSNQDVFSSLDYNSLPLRQHDRYIYPSNVHLPSWARGSQLRPPKNEYLSAAGSILTAPPLAKQAAKMAMETFATHVDTRNTSPDNAATPLYPAILMLAASDVGSIMSKLDPSSAVRTPTTVRTAATVRAPTQTHSPSTVRTPFPLTSSTISSTTPSLRLGTFESSEPVAAIVVPDVFDDENDGASSITLRESTEEVELGVVDEGSDNYQHAIEIGNAEVVVEQQAEDQEDTFEVEGSSDEDDINAIDEEATTTASLILTAQSWEYVGALTDETKSPNSDCPAASNSAAIESTELPAEQDLADSNERPKKSLRCHDRLSRALARRIRKFFEFLLAFVVWIGQKIRIR